MNKLLVAITLVLLTGCASMTPEMEAYLVSLAKEAGHTAVNTAVRDIVHSKTAPTEKCKIYVKGETIRRNCKMD